MNRPKLETGLIGGLICGLIGPGLPGMELSLYGWYQGVPPALQLGRFQGRWSEILALWLYGLFLYGVPAFLIGIVFALLLRSRSARVESSARLAAEALLLGAIFGAAIPFLAFIVPLCMIPFEYSGWPRGVSIWTYVLDTLALCVRTGVFLLPKATGAGSACGLLLVWILRKRQFLRRRAPETV